MSQFIPAVPTLTLDDSSTKLGNAFVMGVKGRIDLVQKLGLTVGMGLVALHYIHVLTQVVKAIKMIHNKITVRQIIELNSCEYFV